MAVSRRRFLKAVTVGGAAWLAGCGTRGSVGTGPAAPTWVERVDQALSSTARFLLAAQLADGSWHSDVYGPFKDGPSLTPLVLRTLLTLPGGQDLEAGYRTGAAYLASQVQPDGTIHAGPIGIAYPVYTSAGAVKVLSEPCITRYRKQRDVWLAYLCERELTEALGWQPGAKPFSGCGDCP